MYSDSVREGLVGYREVGSVPRGYHEINEN